MTNGFPDAKYPVKESFKIRGETCPEDDPTIDDDKTPIEKTAEGSDYLYT